MSASRISLKLCAVAESGRHYTQVHEKIKSLIHSNRRHAPSKQLLALLLRFHGAQLMRVYVFPQ